MAPIIRVLSYQAKEIQLKHSKRAVHTHDELYNLQENTLRAPEHILMSLYSEKGRKPEGRGFMTL